MHQPRFDVPASVDHLSKIAVVKPPKKPTDKFEARRLELARATLEALAELGYSNTSLRDIANYTNRTHGVIHYYFKDKTDLIICCVKHYKSVCVQRYDQVVENAECLEKFVEDFLNILEESILMEAPLHRLWYDIRTQAMFDVRMHEDIKAIDRSLWDMLWRVLSKMAELKGVEIELEKSTICCMFDGLFQNALLNHIYGDKDATKQLKVDVLQVLSKLT